MLHGAAVEGVRKYGGDADFRVKIVKEKDDLVTLVTITNPRLLEVWSYWMAERTAQVVNSMDLDRLDEVDRATLRIARAINARLAEAKANPIWDPVTLGGTVVKDGDQVFLLGGTDRLLLTGPQAKQVEGWTGRSIVATGFHKIQGQLELTHFVERKERTLELFAMSLCPFGRQAEYSILQYLRTKFEEKERPRLEVRYIFYSRPVSDGGQAQAFTSLHGEKETEENLVQIVLRDQFTPVFHDYLLARAGSDAPWRELARKLGLAEGALDGIQKRIVEERDALIAMEYAYATTSYQIRDGSPSYVWEGRRVGDLRTIKEFAGLQFTSPVCSGGS